ncbi:MAG: twin-arginine translocase TatA/TatE family subunit [Candidatus Binatia bacterium]
MFGVGVPELVIILLVALVVLGPRQLPEVAKFLGKALAEFRKATDEITAEFGNAKNLIEEEIRQAELAAQAEENKKKTGTSSVSSATAQPEPVEQSPLTPPDFTVAQGKKEPPTGESA